MVISAQDPTSAILGVGLMLVIGVIIISFLGCANSCTVAAFAALIARLASGLIPYYLYGLTSDQSVYDRQALEIANTPIGSNLVSDLGTGKEAWPTILAAAYRVIGHAPEFGIALNAIAGAMTVIAVANSVRLLGWPTALKPAIWIVALWPVGVLWGGLLLREALVGLLMAIAVNGAIRVFRTRWLSGILLIGSSGLIMIPMRGGLASLILLGLPAILATLVIFSPGGISSKPLRVLLSFGMVGIGLALLPQLNSRAQYFDSDRQEVVSRALNTGTTGFDAAGASGGLSLENPIQSVQTLLTVSVGPFPWQIKNFGLAAVAIDGLLWLAVWYFAWRGFKRVPSKADAILLAMPAAALIGYLAISFTNFGLIMRFRAIGIPIIAPLVGLGIAFLFAKTDSRVRQKIWKKKSPRFVEPKDTIT